jgi:hypothetical protein
VSYKEFGNTHGGDEREVVASLPRRFKELGVDAVVSGHGLLRQLHARRVAGQCSERSGRRAVFTLVCEGFLGLGCEHDRSGLGMPNMPVALVPGHTGVQSERRAAPQYPRNVTLDRRRGQSDSAGQGSADRRRAGAREIICRGASTR